MIPFVCHNPIFSVDYHVRPLKYITDTKKILDPLFIFLVSKATMISSPYDPQKTSTTSKLGMSAKIKSGDKKTWAVGYFTPKGEPFSVTHSSTLLIRSEISRNWKKHENNYFYHGKYQTYKSISHDFFVGRSESDLRLCMRIPYKRYITSIFVVTLSSLRFLNSINPLLNFFS